MNPRLLEAVLGGAAGAITGYKTTKPNQFTGQPVKSQARKNAVIGGLIGLGVGGLAGKPLRALGVKSYEASAKSILSKERAVTQQARQALHRMRVDRYKGKNIGVYDDVFTRQVAPNMNTLLNSRHARPIIEEAIKENRKGVATLPFGIGSLIGKAKLNSKTHRFTVPYGSSGLRLKEDVSNINRKERKYLMDNLFSGSPSDKHTDRLLAHLTKRYYQK